MNNLIDINLTDEEAHKIFDLAYEFAKRKAECLRIELSLFKTGLLLAEIEATQKQMMELSN